MICGAATDACVRATTARALVEGYDTTLVGDAHTTDEGPWDLELPDGRTVPVGAETMVAYTNFFVADTAYPGIKELGRQPRPGLLLGLTSQRRRTESCLCN